MDIHPSHDYYVGGTISMYVISITKNDFGLIFYTLQKHKQKKKKLFRPDKMKSPHNK